MTLQEVNMTLYELLQELIPDGLTVEDIEQIEQELEEERQK